MWTQIDANVYIYWNTFSMLCRQGTDRRSLVNINDTLKRRWIASLERRWIASLESIYVPVD
jgi:hypothetical protein